MGRAAFIAALFVLGLAGRVRAGVDAHAEMAAALEAQIDLRPAPAVLPTLVRTAPVGPDTASVDKGRGHASGSARGASDAAHAAHQADGPGASAIAHAAKEAADQAAAHAQSKRAKERMSHGHQNH